MNKKILLVDDNEDQLFLTQLILVRAGYEVLTSLSGLMALDIFMQRKSEIFIVVLDILMPDTDGRKLAVKIKAIDPDIPVILFSQYGYKGKSTEWGVEGIDFVMKNDGNKLITLIKRYEQQ